MTKVSQKYKFAVIATDVVIFTIKDNKLQVALIEMKKQPFSGNWAIPGGIIKPNESVDAAAKRHLNDKAGVKDVYLEQLYTFGRVDRDPFGRVVSVTYFALVPSSNVTLKTSKEYTDIAWFPVTELPKMAYDHKEVVRFAVERLKAKLEYTNIVYSLLSKEFSLSDLQQTYEIILDKKLDKRNFRKKILSLSLVKKTGSISVGEAHRPAEMYSFTSRSPKIAQIL